MSTGLTGIFSTKKKRDVINYLWVLGQIIWKNVILGSILIESIFKNSALLSSTSDVAKHSK